MPSPAEAMWGHGTEPQEAEMLSRLQLGVRGKKAEVNMGFLSCSQTNANMYSKRGKKMTTAVPQP